MRRKILGVFVLFVTLFVGLINVSAMSETELRNKVGNEFNINGKIIEIPATYLAQLDSYLSEFELSSSDCDYISSQLDILISDARQQDVSSFDDLYKRCSSTIKAIASNISANTGVKIIVLNNGKLQVNKYNSNEIWGIIDTKIITNTNSMNFLYIALAVTVLGFILLAIKVKKA